MIDEEKASKLVVFFPDGGSVICWCKIFRYEGKMYVHFRNNARHYFNWIPEFNKWHKRLADERGLTYMPVTHKSEIKRYYDHADGKGGTVNYFAKWKCHWASLNCLEITRYELIPQERAEP